MAQLGEHRAFFVIDAAVLVVAPQTKGVDARSLRNVSPGGRI